MLGIIAAFLFLSIGQVYAQTTPNDTTNYFNITSTGSKGGFVNNMKMDQFDNAIRQLQNGRPTITGQPIYQNGFSSGSSTFTATVSFSGGATFTAGSTVTLKGVVAVSSRTVDLASAIGGSGPTQATYVIASDTLTLVTGGNNPIMIGVTGSANCNAANDGPGWSFLVDGAYINSMSNVIGLSGVGGVSATGNSGGSPSSWYMINPGEVSAGSHKYGFIFACNQGGQFRFGWIGAAGRVTEFRGMVYELH